jgi:deoxyribose-phosphate aldolase
MEQLNHLIEHSLLKATTSKGEVTKLCQEAMENGFHGVCVPPYFVKQAARFFKEKKVDQKVITVIGFPFGYSSVSAKVEEIKKAIQDGAHEMDIVVNLSAYLSNDMAAVTNDIQSVVTTCHLQNRLAKIILETGALLPKDILKLADICVAAGANFIKTSTGYYEKGATIEAVSLLKSHLPEKTGIKAAGGIRTEDFARSLVEAGASRIGTSSALSLIVNEKV